MSEYLKPFPAIYAEELDVIDRDSAEQVRKLSNFEKAKLQHLAIALHVGDPTALDRSVPWDLLSPQDKEHYVYMAMLVRRGILYQVDKKYFV